MKNTKERWSIIILNKICVLCALMHEKLLSALDLMLSTLYDSNINFNLSALQITLSTYNLGLSRTWFYNKCMIFYNSYPSRNSYSETYSFNRIFFHVTSLIIDFAWIVIEFIPIELITFKLNAKEKLYITTKSGWERARWPCPFLCNI